MKEVAPSRQSSLRRSRSASSLFLLLAGILSAPLLSADCFVPTSNAFRTWPAGSLGDADRQLSLFRFPRQLRATKGRRGSGNNAGTPPYKSDLFDFAFLASGFGGGGGGGSSKNAVQAGIEGALVLTDPKRRGEFNRDVHRRFPWIPPGVVESCTGLLADGFSDLAPADLKSALAPGGLEKVRPKLEGTVVRNLQAQAVVRNLPLSEGDRQALLVYMVRTSLDLLLRDVQPALAAPSLRLAALDRERREVLRYMSLRQRVGYRVRHRPLRTAGLAMLVAWALYLSHLQYGHTVFVSTAGTIFLRAYATAKALLVQLITAVVPFRGRAQRGGFKRRAAASKRTWRL
jgi:hypothetical protein